VSQLDDADQLLRSRPLADVGRLLKGNGPGEIEHEIARLAAGGLRAHVVVTPLGEELGPWQALWTRQGYDPRHDLLLLFNGRRWEARGWHLTPAAIDSALEVARPGLRQYYARGLVLALANLARATGRPPDKREPKTGSSLVGVVVGAGAVTAAAALGWVIVRRRRLARERRQTLAEARSAADQVFADVVLATEDMAGPEAVQLREKATRLRDQIDALAPPNLKQLPAKEESLTLAQLRQMENELEALRSSVLQVKRRP
jgi:LPXTG-motif cell wall-anchored protein